MKSIIQKLKNIWAIEELRNKIIFTMIMLVVYRIGSFISLPGIDSSKLSGLASQTSGNV